MKQALVASALIAGVTASASASLFAQNPNGSNGLFADSTGDAPLQQIADDFVLTANATVGAVTFWGGYFNDNNAYADDFTVKIYEDSAGEPGAELLSTTLSNLVRTDTGTDLFGVDEYRYEADLTTVFNATAGVSYFLSIQNSGGVPGTAGGFGNNWFWEVGDAAAGAGLGSAFTPDAGLTWNTDSQQSLAFVLEVPAPGAVALAGCAGVVAGRRRRK